MIQPCLIIDQPRAASLMGTAAGPVNPLEEEFKKSCVYEQVAGGRATDSMFFRMEVKLNTQAPANVMKTWQSSSESTYAINETRDVPWSDLGELRIGTYKPGTEDEHASVILLAYVITSDSIYMKLSASGPTGTGASMAAILQTVAEELADGVLAAQP